MVVLVAGISYLGYFSTRIAGPQRGILLTAVSGGMVSSTAVTLTLARLQKEGRHFDPLYATGIILALGDDVSAHAALGRNYPAATAERARLATGDHDGDIRTHRAAGLARCPGSPA
ncbi:MAG: DUF4010 domain-containing protein [Gammaproteobacteria bacterium]|nr:DUF4010 domain-containing protein [Gammaproteobacteria bacterium]